MRRKNTKWEVACMKVKVVVTDASVGNKCGQGCQAEGSCRC